MQLNFTQYLSENKVSQHCSSLMDTLKFQNQEEINEILNWANGFMVVYSVCDRHSFSQCFRLLNEIARISPQTSLVVVGNKQDLEAGRKIEFEEGKSLAAKFCAQFFEVKSNRPQQIAYDHLRTV